MPMIETADIVAKRYGVSREAQDEYALESQRRTAAGAAGRPLRRRDRADDDDQGGGGQGHQARCSQEEVTLTPATNATGRTPRSKGLPKLKPVRGEDQFITAGNASQLSDGASACVLMSRPAGGAARARAARHLPRLRRRRLRAGRDGHRPGVRGAAAAGAPGPRDGRHRPVGAERGVRQPGALLPRPARHSERAGSTSTAARSRSATRTA